MTLFKNSMHFKIKNNGVYDRNQQIDLTMWVLSIGSNYASTTNVRMAPSIFPREDVMGAWYYHLIKTDQITHVKGVDNFDHYIKKDKAWADTVVETKTNDILDENGAITGTETIEIKNRDLYPIRHENDTDVLIKIIDKDFNKMFELLNFVEVTKYNRTIIYPVNAICSDTYDKAINKAVLDKDSGEMIGGEFYVEPTETEE